MDPEMTDAVLVIRELIEKNNALEEKAQKRYLAGLDQKLRFLEKLKFITDNEIALCEVMKRYELDSDVFN